MVANVKLLLSVIGTVHLVHAVCVILTVERYAAKFVRLTTGKQLETCLLLVCFLSNEPRGAAVASSDEPERVEAV